MPVHPAAALDRAALIEICRKWKVRELSLFGSALRDDFGPESDLDFLVEYAPDARWDAFDFLDMKFELEARLGRPVDLVEKAAIENPWRQYEILRTREVVYAA